MWGGKKYWGNYEEVLKRERKDPDASWPLTHYWGSYKEILSQERKLSEKNAAKLRRRLETRARMLWIADGRKESRDEYYWQRAEKQLRREHIWLLGPICNGQE